MSYTVLFCESAISRACFKSSPQASNIPLRAHNDAYVPRACSVRVCVCLFAPVFQRMYSSSAGHRSRAEHEQQMKYEAWMAKQEARKARKAAKVKKQRRVMGGG